MRIGTALLAVAIAATPASSRAHPGVDVRVDNLDHEIEHHPKDARLYLKRGELHAEDGRFEDANRDFDRAAVLAPDLADVHYYRGAMMLDAKKHSDAEAQLDAFIAVRPDHPKARFLRAKARAKQAKHRGAASDYTAGLALVKTPTPGPYFERARSLISVEPKPIEEVLRGLDEGCARLGSPIVLIELAVDIEANAGDFDAALRRLDDLPAKLVNAPHWLKRRGDLLRAAGRDWESIAVYVIALGRLSQLPEARRLSPAMVKLATQLRRALAY